MVRERKGNRDALGDDIRWFFSEGDLSAASSFGGFVEMAMTGIQQGGKSNGVERRAVAIADRSDVGRHRGIRRRLLALTELETRHVEVLFAAYGPHDWERVIDRAFGKGMGERFSRALGPEHIGPALLTERLAEMHREAAGPAAVADVPLMEPVDGVRVEDDDDLRDRIVRHILVAHDGAHSQKVIVDAEIRATAVSGDALDALAAKYGRRRGKRRTRRMVATGAKPTETAVPSPGALLASMVAAAYPEKPAKGGKRKLAAEAALRRVREVANEAAMLLTRARMAMPEEERERPRSTARVGSPREHKPRLGYEKARRSGSIVAYDFEEVVRPDGPSDAAAARCT